MKKIILITVLILTSVHAKKPQPVQEVNIKKFSGLWYEMARTFNRFEKGCVASTVEYVHKPNNTYTVHNRCFEDTIGGKKVHYKGSASFVNKTDASVIDMTYYWIFTKRYYVLYVDEMYQKAIVASPDMSNVWIMSRTPKIAQETFDAMVKKLDAYMDTSKLIITPQDDKGRYK